MSSLGDLKWSSSLGWYCSNFHTNSCLAASQMIPFLQEYSSPFRVYTGEKESKYVAYKFGMKWFCFEKLMILVLPFHNWIHGNAGHCEVWSNRIWKCRCNFPETIWHAENDPLQLILEGFKSASIHYANIERLFMFSLHSNLPKMVV